MHQVKVLLRKAFLGIGSSRGRRYASLVANDEWDILQQDVLPSPSTYQNYRVYRRDAIANSLVKKLVLPGNHDLCTAAAVEKFWRAERQCKLTNDRLVKFENIFELSTPLTLSDLKIDRIISDWRKLISAVLGKLPSTLEPRFSSGATLSDSAGNVTIPDKITSVPTMYSHAVWAAELMLKQTPFTRGTEPWRLVRSNRFFTVPKNSQEYRGCCVEASIPVSLQLALGKEMEHKLGLYYKTRIDGLQPYHRWLAQVGSRHGTLATIDLSSASDTVAKRLVKLLLPWEWYEALESLRARSTVVNGQVIHLEKFSSMGNGYTFPLECLLFRTLAQVLGSNCASVFGDDIVIESELANDMIGALRYFGFTPNESKTFCEGPFRESCGGDFFNGHPVRGFFIKELPCEPQHWVKIANGLRHVDPNLEYLAAAYYYAIDQLPKVWREARINRAPDDDGTYQGDLALYDPKAPIRARAVRVGDWAGTMPCFRVMKPVNKTFQLDSHFHGLVQIWARNKGCEATVTPRGCTTGYRPSWLPTYGTAWLP